jgi:hypothetical protein
MISTGMSHEAVQLCQGALCTVQAQSRTHWEHVVATAGYGSCLNANAYLHLSLSFGLFKSALVL